MREAMIILPNSDNDGALLADVQDFLAEQLIDAFNGCTIRAAFGAWRSPDGVTMREAVSEFIVACEPSAANAAKLRDIARHIGTVARQLAIYVRYASGDVEIIDTTPQLQVNFAALAPSDNATIFN